MRKKTITVALLAALSLASISCQKEAIETPQATLVAAESAYSIHYTIDGVEHQTSFADSASWQTFLRWLFVQAENGHNVSVYNTSATDNRVAVKDTVTYVTHDKDDAFNWAGKMVDEGYHVTISFNPDTGEYTCIATN